MPDHSQEHDRVQNSRGHCQCVFSGVAGWTGEPRQVNTQIVLSWSSTIQTVCIAILMFCSYSASKAGMDQATRVMAAELGPHNVSMINMSSFFQHLFPDISLPDSSQCRQPHCGDDRAWQGLLEGRQGRANAQENSSGKICRLVIKMSYFFICI